ncbi:MAG: EF-P lysine aminoacylase EpmA [Myxococcaceae bacterium]
MPIPRGWAAARARQNFYASLRASLGRLGYLEVETPCLVPAPGMEPHISAFEVPFIPETDVGRPRTLYLHSSPEYAMKRLLADGAGPLFQICKVFRNGEVSRTHNPEFSMLEFYRPEADMTAVMADLEAVLAAADVALGASGFFARTPYERLTVREAVGRAADVDLAQCPDATTLRAAVRRVGVDAPEGESFEDVFFRLFLSRVEPSLGASRPTYLTEYPAPMASLARLKPTDASVAERFELYAHGLELANGFSELTDAQEQRRRLLEEQAQRRAAGRAVYPLDEAFLEAVGRLPPSGGVAVGLDRLLMLFAASEDIAEVLLFPADGFL